MCKVLVDLKSHDELLTYTVGATILPLVFERVDWNKSINFACLIACILKNDGKNAFNILKHFIIEVIMMLLSLLIELMLINCILVQKLKQNMELCRDSNWIVSFT